MTDFQTNCGGWCSGQGAGSGYRACDVLQRFFFSLPLLVFGPVAIFVLAIVSLAIASRITCLRCLPCFVVAFPLFVISPRSVLLS